MEVPIKDSIEEAIEEHADVLVVTGMVTGQNPTLEQVKTFKSYSKNTPVILGSGINKDNVKDFFQVADGAIVGSSFKYNGDVFDQIDPVKVKAFMQELGR